MHVWNNMALQTMRKIPKTNIENDVLPSLNWKTELTFLTLGGLSSISRLYTSVNRSDIVTLVFTKPSASLSCAAEKWKTSFALWWVKGKVISNYISWNNGVSEVPSSDYIARIQLKSYDINNCLSTLVRVRYTIMRATRRVTLLCCLLQALSWQCSLTRPIVHYF